MPILIADHDNTARAQLIDHLRASGRAVLVADNISEAMEVFLRERPELVLLDLAIAVPLDLRALKEIKGSNEGSFAPLILTAGAGYERAIAACLEAGADDFVTKPWHIAILDAKIAAQERNARRHQKQRDHAARLEWEKSVAREIFERIVRKGCLDRPQIEYQLSPVEVLNGDFLLAAENPMGKLLVMLGDMSGHDLSAAAGSLPIAEIFYAMVGRGFALTEIALEMNTKLRQLLPRGMFCAALLAEWSPISSILNVWNSGIPDAYLLRPGQGIQARFVSTKPPLGILENERLDRFTERVEARPGDHFFAHSDGVTDVIAPSGDRFGATRLIAELEQHDGAGGIARRLMHELDHFRSSSTPPDDVTFVDVCLHAHEATVSVVETPVKTRLPEAWSIELDLGLRALQAMNPVPEIMRLAAALRVLGRKESEIHTVIQELFVNALDHGVLRLESSLKETSGFAQYFEEREARLKDASDGRVRIRLSNRGVDSTVQIEIEDSGDGFDCQKVPTGDNEELATSGRGIRIVRALCEEIAYSNGGRRVEATFNPEK